jgi:CSLREA domain-containing protein
MSAPPADAAEPPDTAPPPDTTPSLEDTAGAAADTAGATGLDAPPGCLVVTTAADEDNGATNGLSLREALAAANATAGHDCITFSGPMTIRPTTNLPVLEDPAGASIFGGGVVFIDGAMNTTAARRALQFSEGNNTVSGREMGNLPNEANDVCIHAKSSNNTIGPAVYLHDCGQGMQLEGNDNEVKASRFARNGSAIKVNPNSMRARLWLNVFTDNLTEAIQMNAPATDSFLRHNTFFRNPHGLKLKGVIVRVAVQNNVFVSMGTTDNGITYDAGSTFMPLDHNDFFGFAANRACDGCMGLMGPNTLSVDPMFVSPAGGDLRLQPGSPVIDKGIDTLLDVNGAAAGLYNGSAPDMGAFESP